MIKRIYKKLHGLRFWRHGVITPPLYYQIVWVSFLTLTAVLVHVSDAASQVAIGASYALSVIAFSIINLTSVRKKRVYYTPLFYGCCFLILTWAFLSERQNKDAAVIVMEILLAVIPALLGNMGSQKRVFAAITASNLLGIGAILLANDIRAYNIFIVFIGAMALTMNATKIYFLSLDASDTTEKLTINYFYQLLRAIPYGLAMGAVIFYAFPRMSDLALDLNLSGVGSRTGYTSQIMLQKSGDIREDDKINLWVRASDPEWLANEASSIYIRGTSLDQFDGVQWKNSGTPNSLASSAKDFRVNKAHQKRRERLTFYREAVSSRDVLVPYGLWQIEFNQRLNHDIFIDNFGNMQITRDNPQRYQYEISMSPQIANTIGAFDFDQSELAEDINRNKVKAVHFYQLDPQKFRLYTQTPNLITSQPWFANFVSAVNRSNSEGSQANLIAATLVKLQRYFRRNYQATLKSTSETDEPLKEFLTTNKEGHCELFATAAALYLRSMGIPTRLVSGYFGGQFNVVSQMLEVPEKFAHAWLEVYHPQSGWLIFDPTPQVVRTNATNTWHETFRTVVNAITFWITRYVVDYDMKAQRELGVTISRIDMSKLSDLNNLSWDQNTGELGLLIVLLGFAIWLLIRVLTRDDHLPDAPDYYRKLMARFLRSGYQKQPGESYLAFHKRLADEGVNVELLEIAHVALERDIYTNRPLAIAERRTVKKALRRLPLKQKKINAKQTDPSLHRAHG